MAATKYKCLNFAECNKAIEHEVIEIEDGEEQLCPECGSKIELFDKKPQDGLPKWVIPVAALVCVVGLLVWFLMPSPKPKPTPPPVNPTNKLTSTTPPPVAPLPADACTDSQLATTIKDRLAHDEDLKGDVIQVDVANKTVILSGTVENDLARTFAADIVKRTGCPITSIVNDIKLGLPDQAILKQIKQSYAKDSALKSQPIQVEVSHGNVVLSGYVTESLARTVAADHASHVNGVVTVTNNLLVHPTPAPGSLHSSPPSTSPTTNTPSAPPNLSGLWTGTIQTCAQGQSTIRIRITDAAPDDITASVEITMPNDTPGTFTAHGVLNTMNSFLALQFSGWQHQPPGVSMGNIGGYITYNNQRPDGFSGVIKSPGCGQITLKKQ